MRLGIFILTMVMGLLVTVDLARGHMPLNDSERQKILKGIREIVVVVKHGLSRGGKLQIELQDLVENQLLTDGLILFKEEDQPADSFEMPSLCIDVTILKSEPENYSFLVGARFNEGVVLLRDKKKVVYATTWTAKRIGVGGDEIIKETVDKIIKFFLIDYRASKDSIMGS